MSLLTVQIIVKYILFSALFCFSKCLEVDSNGYVAYCPCMGRFGNQADHFLGSLEFAHSLNRTLILPPWIEYRTGSSSSVQIPFDTYFKVSPLQEYHRVITMEDFMQELSEKVWPKGKRKVFCYMSRGTDNECNAKDGNPFGPFWDHFNIDFDESIIYKPLHYNVKDPEMVKAWMKQYPVSEYPVLAFVGAPAAFPVQEENVELQKYLEWSDYVQKQANEFISANLPNAPFVGIHLRNGQDWVRACEHVKSSPLLFSAPQCLGYRGEKGQLTIEICFPSKKAIIQQVRQAVKRVKAKAVFVASDSDHMIGQLNKAFKKLEVKAYSLPTSNPQVDLAILEKSHHFIGNCISSFTAFVKRARDVHGLPSSFWGVKEPARNQQRDEL